MLFNTAQFACFFLLFFCVYHFVVRGRVGRLWLMAIGSAVFYAAWDVRFVPLLFGTATLDFYFAREIGRSEAKPRRRALLVASVVLNLGVLAFFKYATSSQTVPWGCCGFSASS